MFKLVALDLDGTLLNSNKNISIDDLKYLRKLIDAGIKVVIATGRRYYAAKELTKKIDRNITILANNGNIVRNTIDDKEIFSRFLNKDDYKMIILAGKDRDLNPIIHVDYYDSGYDMVIEKNIINSGSFDYLPKTDNRYKIIDSTDLYDLDRVLALVYPGKIRDLIDFNYEINQKFPNKYNSHLLEYIDVAEAMYEVMSYSGSKWKSLLEYSSVLGINAGEIISMGDDNNDLEMILNSGLGIAMRNGSSLVQKAANLITERDNNNSGVSFELSKIFGI